MTDPRDWHGSEFQGYAHAIQRAWLAYYRPTCLIAPKTEVLFYPVQKAGTTAVQRILAQAEGVGAPPRENDYGTLFEWARPGDPRVDDIGGWTSFTVVRNPWARLASCYKEKFIGDMPDYSGERQELYNGFERYNKALGFKVFWLEMSFEQFVRRVCWIPDIIADPHIKSQWRRFSLPNGELLVDVILHLEDTQEIERFLTTRGALKPGQSFPQVRATKGPNWCSMYDDELVRMVGKRYARDIALLGYKPPFG